MERHKTNLLQQLNNLILIVDLIPIQKNFILGYILKSFSSVNPQTIKQLIRVIELILEVQACQIIKNSHVLELIVVLSHVCENLSQNKITSLMNFYEQSVESILNDNDYLINKYFHSQVKYAQIKIQQLSKISEDNQSMDLKRGKSDIAECPVCLMEIKHQHVCVLGCGHIIHQQCFEQCMKESILNKKFPLKCPFEQCKKYIETQDIEEYLPKQLIEKYYEFTLHNFVQKNTKNMSWCPTAGCSNAFEFGENITNFDCIKCQRSYCLKCKTQAHFDKTCEQNKAQNQVQEVDKQFMDFVKGANYKQCPECKFWVERNHGCCHMTCRCGFQFCYRCGAKHGECNCESEYENYYGSQDDDGSDVEDREIDQDEQFNQARINQMDAEQQALGVQIMKMNIERKLS